MSGNMLFEGKRLIVEEKKETVFSAEEKNKGEGKGGSFARSRSIRIIIFERLVDPDDHFKRPVDRNDHLQETS